MWDIEGELIEAAGDEWFERAPSVVESIRLAEGEGKRGSKRGEPGILSDTPVR